MKTLKHPAYFLGLILGLLLSTTIWANSQEEIKRLADSTTNNSLQILAQQKSQIESNPALLNNLVNQHILPFVDLSAMSKLALGGQNWKKASVMQRQQFTQGFKQMLIRTYSIALLEHIKGQNDLNYKFKTKRTWVDGQYASAIGELIRNNGKPNVNVKYDLRNVEGNWLIYNIHVEGIDYIKSFRNSFQQEIRTAGLDSLIARLQGG